ncbi:uncharacterized protein VP01_907g3 [Puccinia sorghi]|uniref:HAT C-terminal dimerisation domain-containing protein n=1 Tax=Puccinia sorghi TaxID=27349 RepID=A0A0L6U9S7_9BASI|nr:uncharacterized protein VP01_907g3 [Puccinia sorghi]
MDEKVLLLIWFFEPLHEATEFLCSFKYPTLNMSLPIYISLMMNICQLKKYLVLAFQKTAPLCAMILDPHINIFSDFSPAAILLDFKVEAQQYDRSPARCGSNQLESKTELNASGKDYLHTSNEGPKTDVLNYWCSKMSIHPLLAAMESCFLAIPAPLLSKCSPNARPSLALITQVSQQNQSSTSCA